MADTMAGMEHPQPTIYVPSLVDEKVLLRFCQAVQQYGDSIGSHDETGRALRLLNARLDGLRGLAVLCCLAIVGNPHSLARVADEMECLAVDFPPDPLEDVDGPRERNEDEADGRVMLAAAVDLFAGASFANKDRPERRDRFIIGIVRAIEDAIGFPAVFADDAEAFLDGASGQVPLHAETVIANATQRLIDGDQRCVPRAPREARRQLRCLAHKWMRSNPVDEFFRVVSGPKVRHIVHWEDPARTQPDDAREGDQVTLVVAARRDDDCWNGNDDVAVMFCPHQPAAGVRQVNAGYQVHVPPHARTGPIAIIHPKPDFTSVKALIQDYADEFPTEWSMSIFAVRRLDMWAYPDAFGPPILEILPTKDERPRQVVAARNRARGGAIAAPAATRRPQ
jgi:hypothetical protein